MWIRDEGLWQQTRSEIAGDGALGDAFIAFVLDWCERAQEVMVSSRTFQREDGTWEDEENPAAALRVSLPAAEFHSGSESVSLSILAQALVVILANWGPGPDVFANLTSIESKVVGDMLAIKYQELQRQAAAAT